MRSRTATTTSAPCTVHTAQIIINMSQVTLIYGGHGKCAQLVTALLVGAGHTVHSVIRNAAQIGDIERLGARPIVQDIETASVDAMAAVIGGTRSSTVIWCAGAGPKASPETIHALTEGSIRTQDASAAAGARRYVSISALDVRDRSRVPFPPWYNENDRSISERAYAVIGLHLDAKLTADRSLVAENARRGLDFTIVRPNGLLQDPGTGNVEAGKVHLNGLISRQDVAAVVVECLKNDATKGLVFDLVSGSMSVSDAVATVAKNRDDTFEGMY